MGMNQDPRGDAYGRGPERPDAPASAGRGPQGSRGKITTRPSRESILQSYATQDEMRARDARLRSQQASRAYTASAAQRDADRAARREALAALSETKTAQDLDALRVKYLGKKGALTAVLKQMGGLSAEERPIIGQLANEVREALTTAKLWDVLQPQAIQGASVRQVLDYVARGEVDAGFVYGTDAKQQAAKVDVVMVVPGHTPVLYPIAVATTGKNPKMGQAFLDFVLSPEGQAVLSRYGFSKP